MGPIEGCQQGSGGDGWVTAYHSRSVNQPAGSFAMCPSLFVCLFGVRLCERGPYISSMVMRYVYLLM